MTRVWLLPQCVVCGSLTRGRHVSGARVQLETVVSRIPRECSPTADNGLFSDPFLHLVHWLHSVAWIDRDGIPHGDVFPRI